MDNELLVGGTQTWLYRCGHSAINHFAIPLTGMLALRHLENFEIEQVNMDHKTPLVIANNPEQNRIEVFVDSHLAKIDYYRSGTRIIFTHTHVPPELEGLGIGSQLARFALDYARENHLQVVPLCPFVLAYIKRHREYRDLVTPPLDD